MNGYVKREEYDQLKQSYDRLKHELDQLKRLIFGSKTERFFSQDIPGQLNLDLDIEQCIAIEEVAAKEAEVKTKKKKNLVSRHPLPAHLPRTQLIIEPEEYTSGMKYIGDEVTEVLAKQPTKYYVIQIIRRKYAKADGSGVVIGKIPSRAIEKRIAHESVLADMIVSKYVDHLPLYRQAKILSRQGIRIASSTMSDWMASCGRLLEPLYEVMKKEVLQSDYLQVDESPIKVQDKNKKGSTHRGYQWVYHDVSLKLVLFDYQKGRGREGPRKMLENYEGYLQTDGYGVYEAFGKKPGITLLGCMAHARCYFEQALGNDGIRARYFLKQVQQLYLLERQLKEQNAVWEERLKTRQKKALPILEGLKTWLIAEQNNVLPQSAIGQAIHYSLVRWHKLTIYAYHGGLEIDNNLIENQIRPLALGRKNYLFAGSHESAKYMAIFYSILGSCLLHDLDPFEYLYAVLSDIPEYPINKLPDLLPCYVRLERP